MQKKAIITLAFVLLVVLSASAQLLWRVSGGSLERQSYLFGTMHQVNGNFIDSIKGLNDAIGHVDGVWVEIEDSQLNSKEALSYLSSAMLAPADSTVDQFLSPAGIKIVKGVIDKYFGGLVSFDTFKKLKPAAIMTQIQVLQLIEIDKGINLSNVNALLDATVQTRARAAGKTINSLETLEFQARLLFGYPLREQAADLLEFCKADAVVLDKTAQLVKAYKHQDLGKIVEIMQDPEMGGDAQEMERMVYSRNRNWVKTLVPVMQQGSVLVAVGAGHLPGDNGLIALLRKAGYTVEPVQ